MTTLSPIPSNTVPPDNGTIIGIHSDSTIIALDNNNNCFSQDCCRNLLTDYEKIDQEEPIEIPVSKKIVFKFAKPKKVLLY
ncbi:MAG: hypothetical protein LBH59_01365 [Planctomycetaceae bacterium]|jgi:hypothetical protein|nr:hypothetical protein [Planctomycetaceae bacterium]